MPLVRHRRSQKAGVVGIGGRGHRGGGGRAHVQLRRSVSGQYEVRGRQGVRSIPARIQLRVSKLKAAAVRGLEASLGFWFTCGFSEEVGVAAELLGGRERDGVNAILDRREALSGNPAIRWAGDATKSPRSRAVDPAVSFGKPASKSSAPSKTSSVRARPIKRTRCWIPPPPGGRPNAVSGWAKIAVSRAAKRMSQAARTRCRRRARGPRSGRSCEAARA